MKYRLWACLLFLPMVLWASGRPKVAVVLSGGGAKGTAHIGALKVIEEAGIPIDYVVGTSMGAIVGGLYSIGYTPQQLDSMVNAQNWKFLLSDAPNPKDVLLDDRLKSERYVLSIPFSLKSAAVSDAGIIKGKNLARLFSTLTEGYQDSVDFSRLPIPFACVSENLVNGSEVVFHEGILATSMRSSMSIPGVFAPVDLDGMVLVDGGMVNNYPVDVALAMGADYIIGVDVQSPLLKASELKSVKDIFGQIINLQGEKKYRCIDKGGCHRLFGCKFHQRGHRHSDGAGRTCCHGQLGRTACPKTEAGACRRLSASPSGTFPLARRGC